MKIFLVFNSAAFGLKCQTGRQDSFGTNQTYVLTDCPDDGQEWSCQNELRIHGSQYWAHTKVRKSSFENIYLRYNMYVICHILYL